MTALARFASPRPPAPQTDALPVLVTAAGERASIRFIEFFAVTIRNPHTRRAYMRAVADFLAWCEDAGVRSETASRILTGRGIIMLCRDS